MPRSCSSPSLITQIESAFEMVDSRCAMTIVVTPAPPARFSLAMSSSSAACTIFSDSLSSAEVASSRSSTAGLRMIARAMATRCFCPPEILEPPAPTSVW